MGRCGDDTWQALCQRRRTQLTRKAQAAAGDAASTEGPGRGVATTGPSDGILPTMLFTHRREVHQTNSKQLRALPGPDVVFSAIDVAAPPQHGGGYGTGASQSGAVAMQQLARGCPARQVLRLKVSPLVKGDREGAGAECPTDSHCSRSQQPMPAHVRAHRRASTCLDTRARAGGCAGHLGEERPPRARACERRPRHRGAFHSGAEQADAARRPVPRRSGTRHHSRGMGDA